jgi:hypothetical protein
MYVISFFFCLWWPGGRLRTQLFFKLDGTVLAQFERDGLWSSEAGRDTTITCQSHDEATHLGITLLSPQEQCEQEKSKSARQQVRGAPRLSIRPIKHRCGLTQSRITSGSKSIRYYGSKV